MRIFVITILVILLWFTVGLLHPYIAIAQPDDGRYEDWYIFQDNNKALIALIIQEEVGEHAVEPALEIVDRESDFDCEAQNPKSTAFGCWQFLDSTWQGEKTTNPRIQTLEAIAYVQNRYNTFNKALEFHNNNNYY